MMDSEQGGEASGVSPRLGVPGPARAPLTVLLVDPDAERARTLAEGLRAICLVAVAATAQAASAIIAARVPDMVVCDLELPDVPGPDFLALLRTTPATRRVLLMVISSRQAIRDKIAALRAGADDYLVWPFEPAMFVQRVRLLSHFRPLF
jgi:DNA-binding response OmpR family regulator